MIKTSFSRPTKVSLKPHTLFLWRVQRLMWMVVGVEHHSSIRYYSNCIKVFNNIESLSNQNLDSNVFENVNKTR